MPTNEHAQALFAEIASERLTLADTLVTLTHDQWEAQSLCSGWSVRNVAAHLAMPFVTPLWKFGLTMLRTRGNFDRANESLTRRTRMRYGNQLPELLSEHAHSRFTPPGEGPLAPLTDVIVHGQDIRRPLNIDYAIPDHRQIAVLDFIAASANSSPVPVRSEKVRWQATDLDWTYGDGPTVEGPAASLMLVLTGRDDALADITGPGRERLVADTS